MGVSKNSGTPKSSICSNGFFIFFTIHFGGFPPILGNIHMLFLFSVLNVNTVFLEKLQNLDTTWYILILYMAFQFPCVDLS